MDQRMFLALALSMAVIFGYYTLFPQDSRQKPPADETAGRERAALERLGQGEVGEATSAAAAPRTAGPGSEPAAEATARRISVETPRYRALFDTRGARLVSLQLKNYRRDKELIDWADVIPPLRAFIDKDRSDPEALVEMVKNQLGIAEPLSMEFKGDRALSLEFRDKVFSVDRERVTLEEGDDAPATLTFVGRASNGLTLKKRITFHAESYAIDVELEVINYGTRPLPLEMVTLFGEGPVSSGDGNIRSHFGPIYFENGEVETEDPDDVAEGLPIPDPDWVGITANYFLSAAAYQPQPSILSSIGGEVSLGQDGSNVQRVVVTPEGGEPRAFLVPLLRNKVLVKNGQTVEAGEALAVTRVARAEFRAEKAAIPGEDSQWVSYFGMELPRFELDPNKMYSQPIKFRLYLGPKKSSELEKFGSGLEEAITQTFDWLTFLADPLLAMLHWFNGFSGNYGVAIIMLTVVVRVGMFPLTYKGMVSMKRMQKIQPRVVAMKEKFKNDRERQNKEMMALYKRYKVNPLGGCLPIALQLPIFFALYSSLLGAIELRHAPFIFWIADLSAKDPLYVTPILMGATMFLQQKLTPSTMDPTQQKILQFMPLIFLVFMINFPSGLVLYWLTSNSLSILQQLIINRIKVPEPTD